MGPLIVQSCIATMAMLEDLEVARKILKNRCTDIEFRGIFESLVAICDCLSKNPPSSHLLVFREVKIQQKTSLALVVESFTEHNNT